MSDDISLHTNVQTGWNTQIDNTGITTGQTTKIKDTIEGGDNSHGTPTTYYYSPPGQPKLVAASTYSSTSDLDAITNLVKNYPQNILAAADMLPAPDTKFLEEAETLLSRLSDEELAHLGGGLPKEQVIKMVRFAMLHPDAKMPGDIAQAGALILKRAVEITGQEPSPMIAIVSDKLANFSFTSLLKGEFIKLGLSPKVQQQLLAAHDMPEFAGKLSPELQTILKNAEKSAFANVQKEFGIPEDWEMPRDPVGYQNGLSMDYESKIGDILWDKLSDGELSKADYNALRSMLYVPGTVAPTPALKALFDEIMGDAKGQIQGEWGFPDGFEPEINPEIYNAILTGGYYASANKAIASQTPPLSADDQALLKKALSSDEARKSLPPHLQEVFATIAGTAVDKIKAQYSLPEDWAPDPVMLSKAESVVRPNLAFAQGALGMGMEFVTHLKGMNNTFGVESLRELNLSSHGGAKAFPPAGNKLLNYLRNVSLALSALQEVLFAATMTDADLSKTLNRIQQDAAIGKLEKQRKSIEETKAKQAKMKAMGPFKFILMIIIALLILITCGGLGVVLAPIIPMLLVINTLVMSKGDMSKMDIFENLCELIKKVGTAIGGPTLAKILQALVSIFIMVLAPWVFAIDLLVGSASLVSNFLKAVGVPDDIVGYITMAIQLVAMILSAGIAIVLTMGADTVGVGAQVAEMAMNIGGQLAQKVYQAVADVCEVIMAFLDKFNGVSEAVKIALDAAESAVNALTGQVKQAKSYVSSCEDMVETALKAVEKGANPEILEEAQAMLETAVSDLESLTGQLESKVGELGQLEEQVNKGVMGAIRQFVKEVGKLAQKAATKAGDEVKEMKELVKSIKEAEKAVAKAEASLEGAESSLEAGESNLETFERVLAQTRMDPLNGPDAIEDAGRMVENARTAVNELKQAVTEAEHMVEMAKNNLNVLSKALEKAVEKASAFMNTLSEGAQLINSTSQASVQINNSILEAQIAIIKGKLEAYMVEVEAFIKILKSLIAKLLQSLQDLGKILAGLGNAMQDMYRKLSEASTNAAQAMAA